MGEIVISKVQGEDLKAIQEELADFLEGQRGKEGVFKNMSKGYVKHVILSEDDSFTIIARDGDELVGSASVFKRNQESSQGVLTSGFVTAVAVKEGRQGQGIGKRIMQGVTDEIKANYDTGILFSDVTRLYEKFGFEVVPWFYTISGFSEPKNNEVKVKVGLSDDLVLKANEIYHESVKGVPVFPSRERISGLNFIAGLRKAVFKNFKPKESDFLPFNNNCFYGFFKEDRFLGYAYAVSMKRQNGYSIIDLREIAAENEEDYRQIRDALMRKFGITSIGSYLPPQHKAYKAFHEEGTKTETVEKCGEEGGEPKLFKEYMMILGCSEKGKKLVAEKPRMGYFALDEGYFFTPQQLLKN